jgi:hypothetical protein
MFILLTFDACLIATTYTTLSILKNDDGGRLWLEAEFCLPDYLLVLLLGFLFNYSLFLAVHILLFSFWTLCGRLTWRLTYH